MKIHWKWSRLDALSAAEMHAILAVRQRIFVVEQCCAYQDADTMDREAWHLTGRDALDHIVTYLRLTPPGVCFDTPSIGRLLTVRSMRGQHLARQAMEFAIARCAEMYPGSAIRIAAQTYLLNFYRQFGFVPTGTPYDDDGIAHRDMVRPGPTAEPA
jgi:ElaA protein